MAPIISPTSDEASMHTDPLWIIMILVILAFFFWQTRHS
jgi:hypothetical protein